MHFLLILRMNRIISTCAMFRPPMFMVGLENEGPPVHVEHQIAFILWAVDGKKNGIILFVIRWILLPRWKCIMS